MFSRVKKKKILQRPYKAHIWLDETLFFFHNSSQKQNNQDQINLIS